MSARANNYYSYVWHSIAVALVYAMIKNISFRSAMKAYYIPAKFQSVTFYGKNPEHNLCVVYNINMQRRE